MTVEFKNPVSGEMVSFDGLPENSRQAIVNRGMSHLFGNECASLVTSAIRTALVNGTARKASDVNTTEVQAFRADESNGAFVSDALAKARTTKIEALLAGTIGVRVGGGESIDPVEAEMYRIASEEMRALFAAQGWASPSSRPMIWYQTGLMARIKRASTAQRARPMSLGCARRRNVP
jgi:hypothetical protein